MRDEASSSLVQMGCGLPALPKKLIEKIEAGEYVDFTELPPVKGKCRSQAFDGQIVVVQAADLVQTRRLIPDLATWVQCFRLFTSARARGKPERLPDMMAYMAIVAKASQKFKWVIYDQNFRMEMAGNPTQSWTKVDAQCFTGQAFSLENWCSECHGLDHTSGRCPYKPQAQKRSWGAAFRQAPARAPPSGPTPKSKVPSTTATMGIVGMASSAVLSMSAVVAEVCTPSKNTREAIRQLRSDWCANKERMMQQGCGALCPEAPSMGRRLCQN